jgi:HAMP domain-containing protein
VALLIRIIQNGRVMPVTEPQTWTMLGVFSAFVFSALALVSYAFVRILRTEIGALRSEIGGVRTEIGGVRTEIGGLRTEVRTEIGSLRTELRTEIAAVRTEIGALGRRIDGLDRDVQALMRHTFGINRE